MPERDVCHTLLEQLHRIVGQQYLITDPHKNQQYRTGFRFGSGNALAVVLPANVIEQWEVVKACHAADVIIISQAANTGLTGGSTPDGNDYDRPVVIINTLRIDRTNLINNGTQIVCHAGATLYQLEAQLARIGREPHSVIGSSCIGASVVGGVCNNSGGSLVKRGPSYTELALYARVNEQGKLQLINHLGIFLGNDPDTILRNLHEHNYGVDEIDNDPSKLASSHDYAGIVTQIDADTPARFNANPDKLHETSGSAGKVVVFAVRLDTFEQERNTRVYYIGSNNTHELSDLRKQLLTEMSDLPLSGEYIHRDAYALAAEYGKDMVYLISQFGTQRLPKLFALKDRIDRWAQKTKILPTFLSDKLSQWFAHVLPKQLPDRMEQFHQKYEHHLIVKTGGAATDEARALFERYFNGVTARDGAYFECTTEEANKAMLHRFAVAGAAVRYRAIHADAVADIVALDVALRRNDEDWFERLPDDINQACIHKLYYGHFLCHVFHQDYIIKKPHDPMAIEHKILKTLDARRAQYPAEHNVGHLYHANEDLARHYRQLDPTNSFNPGIGKLSKRKFWR